MHFEIDRDPVSIETIQQRGDTIQGCARFPDYLQNFSERQILWRMCSVVFHALTLKLPIQTLLSVAPKLPVSLSSHEKCLNFRKTSTTQWAMQTTRKYLPRTIRPDYLIKHPFSALLNLILNWDGHRSVATDSQMTLTIRFWSLNWETHPVNGIFNHGHIK